MNVNIVELCEARGITGERMVEAVMKANGCGRGEAIRQIRWAQGDHRGDQRVIPAEPRPYVQPSA